MRHQAIVPPETGSVIEYVPSTNTWKEQIPMPTARFGLAAVVVNEKIYAIGGDNSKSNRLNVVEEWGK
jgi:hypothetical protein